MSVTVQEILSASRAGLARITAETAGYLVLGAADQLVASSGSLGPIRLAEDGSVAVGQLGEGTATTLERDLRGLLLQLLEQSSTRAPALSRVAQAAGTHGFPSLIGELESSLIPVNRGAARRALARVHRDVLKVKNTGNLAAPGVSPASPAPAASGADPARSTTSMVGARDAAPPAPSDQGHRPEPTVVVAEVAPRRFAKVVPEHTPVVSVAALAEPKVATATQSVVAAPPSVAHPPRAEWSFVEPERTPFLGSWMAVVEGPSRVSSAPPAAVAVEHDTDAAPPVAFDDGSESPLAAASSARDRVTSRTPVFGGISAVSATSAPAVSVDAASLIVEPAVDLASPVIVEPAIVEPAAEPAVSEVAVEPALTEVAIGLAPTERVELAEPPAERAIVELAIELALTERAERAEPAVELAAGALAEPEPAERAIVELAIELALTQRAEPVELAAVEPAEPALAEPALAEPAIELAAVAPAEPALAEPAPAELPVELATGASAATALAEPAPAEPALAEPALAEPALAEPAFAEPAFAEPAFAEPAIPEPEPALVEPAAPAVVAPAVVAPAAATAPAAAAPAVVAPEPVVYRPRKSDVSELLAGFAVAESRSLIELSRELSRMAGVGGTPCPPEAAPPGPRAKAPSAR